jgi:hypothetical protein
MVCSEDGETESVTRCRIPLVANQDSHGARAVGPPRTFTNHAPDLESLRDLGWETLAGDEFDQFFGLTALPAKPGRLGAETQENLAQNWDLQNRVAGLSTDSRYNTEDSLEIARTPN